MNTFQLYKDIEARTNGEIYIGIVGPVRTGKSTFIKRFMDLLVLPKIKDEHARERAKDELPQSASGKTIMTAEPKFVPKEAVQIQLAEDVKVKARLIDCVGYMVDGAAGHMENGRERMVKTPWFEHEIPFTRSAEIGTRKVIYDHATIGIVVTTDGTIGDIERSSYLQAEETTIRELQSIGKPFIVLVNSKKPYGEEARTIAKELEADYNVHAMPVNCEQLKEEDVQKILEAILFSFPVSEIQFFVPKWVEMLAKDHVIKQELFAKIRLLMENTHTIRDALQHLEMPESDYIESWKTEAVEADTGCVKIQIGVPEQYYYQMLSELTGLKMQGQYELISALRELSQLKEEYEEVKDAFSSVKIKGYGVVSPQKEEIELEEPSLIKQGNKYGVKIHAQAPSIHLIKANIETEIAPIVGNEKQAQDLIDYLNQMSKAQEGIWAVNIFGKSVEDLVMDGMKNKITMINEESQTKLQDTMQKIVNDSNGGLVCIII